MHVRDIMTSRLESVTLQHTVEQAAELMLARGLDAMLVRDGDRLAGIVTGHDIAMRVIAVAKHPPATAVREIMTPEISYCFDDEDVDLVLGDMAELQLRVMAVLDRDTRQLVGLVSLVDLALARGGIWQAVERQIQTAAADGAPASRRSPDVF
jgi:CBS domain-containing protein